MTTSYEQFTTLLAKASERVPPLYFQLPVAGKECPIYRERVYCYELYHQLRNNWPFKHLSFCGEVDKLGHPKIHGNGLDWVKPDFIVHQPGSMESNLVVIEVKPATVRRAGIQKDLKHLTSFRRHASYQHAILLIFGGTQVHLQKIKKICHEIEKNFPQEVSLDGIELWWHEVPGTRASLQQWESP